jgi:hypothetical protein
MNKLVVPVAMALLLISFAGPAFATIPKNADIVITCGASFTPCGTTSVSVGGVETISMCMSNGAVGVILNTDSGHGTSGLLVKSPGGHSSADPTGAVTSWTYTPAALAQIPACGSGQYTVSFGAGTAGWAKLSGPTVAQTAEGGTYTVDLNYKQGTSLETLSAVFDAFQSFPTPQFPVPLLAVVGTTMLGLIFLRKRLVKVS